MPTGPARKLVVVSDRAELRDALAMASGPPSAPELILVQNFFEGLKAKEEAGNKRLAKHRTLQIFHTLAHLHG